MKHVRKALAALAFASLLSGCATTRRIIDIHEHPTQPMLFLETIDTTNMLIYATSQHVFWQCVERNNQLQCQRQCGGPGQDFSCPTAAAGGGSASSNVR